MEPAKQLAYLFPSIDSELINVLVESAGGNLTQELLAQLRELHPEPIEIVSIDNNGKLCLPQQVLCGSTVLLLANNGNFQANVLSPLASTPEPLGCGIVLNDFGAHRFQCVQNGRQIDEAVCLATSTVHEYARALDDFYDTFYWSWSQRYGPAVGR
jgi:hypothetical protein